MSSIRRALGRIPWRVALPTIMLAASALLLRLDARWMVGANYWDDMPVTSAWGLLALVNGPGFFLFKFLDGSYVV